MNTDRNIIESIEQEIISIVTKRSAMDLFTKPLHVYGLLKDEDQSALNMHLSEDKYSAVRGIMNDMRRRDVFVLKGGVRGHYMMPEKRKPEQVDLPLTSRHRPELHRLQRLAEMQIDVGGILEDEAVSDATERVMNTCGVVDDCGSLSFADAMSVYAEAMVLAEKYRFIADYLVEQLNEGLADNG